MTKFTIIVDVDDVLLDLLPHWLRLYNADWDDDLTPEDITEWDMTKFVRKACGRRIYDYLDRDDLYASVDILPGAVRGVQALRDMGHRIIFATIKDNPSKLRRLVALSFLSDPREYFVTPDKSVLKGDVIIDDNPEHLKGFDVGILFNRPHNRKSSGGFRLESWAEIVAFIADMGAEKAEPQPQAAGIPGIGRDAPMAVNNTGGKQSILKYNFDLIDPLAMFALARVLHEGATRYGIYNWVRIPLLDNLNHAITHIFAYLAGDTQDDHLDHALTRLTFAVAQYYGRSPDNIPLGMKIE